MLKEFYNGWVSDERGSPPTYDEARADWLRANQTQI